MSIHISGKLCGDCGKHLVSRSVTKTVIGILEVVEIDDSECKWHTLLDQTVDVLHSVRPAKDTCKRIKDLTEADLVYYAVKKRDLSEFFNRIHLLHRTVTSAKDIGDIDKAPDQTDNILSLIQWTL